MCERVTRGTQTTAAVSCRLRALRGRMPSCREEPRGFEESGENGVGSPSERGKRWKDSIVASTRAEIGALTAANAHNVD